MSIGPLLVHGDDALGIDAEVHAFATATNTLDRVVLWPERSPDEAIIDRAGAEAAAMGLFGSHLVVLRQPLRAAGRSTAAAEQLLRVVASLPDGATLALAEERPSRDAGRPAPLLARLATAVEERGGRVVERLAPRRNQLRGWIVDHAAGQGWTIEGPAAAVLAERLGGAVWETDIERGQQTRVADAELRKLAIYADGRAIATADVEALVADTRPASIFAVTNAIDRREPAAAAVALRRALDEGQAVLRIMASIDVRLADLIAARDLLSTQAGPTELARRLARGNARAAERLAEAARRYAPAELEAMLRGLFAADLAIKRNDMTPEAAVVAWLGEYLLGTRRGAPLSGARPHAARDDGG